MTWAETRVFRTAVDRVVSIWFARFTTALQKLLTICYHKRTQDHSNSFYLLQLILHQHSAFCCRLSSKSQHQLWKGELTAWCFCSAGAAGKEGFTLNLNFYLGLELFHVTGMVAALQGRIGQTGGWSTSTAGRLSASPSSSWQKFQVALDPLPSFRKEYYRFLGICWCLWVLVSFHGQILPQYEGQFVI